MKDMVVTLDTSHFEMSLLKEPWERNIPLMSLILDTSHPAIGPWRPVEHSPSGVIRDFKHSSTASLSSSVEGNAVSGHNLLDTKRDDVDPKEPVNINFADWTAFEWTQAAEQSTCANEVA